MTEYEIGFLKGLQKSEKIILKKISKYKIKQDSPIDIVINDIYSELDKEIRKIKHEDN